MVIEPGQDLGAGAAAQRQRVKSDCQHWFGIAAATRLQEDLGRLRGWGMTHAAPGQVPADGRWRDRDPVLVTQMPGDRVRACVQALAGELLAEPDDQVDDLGADRGELEIFGRLGPGFGPVVEGREAGTAFGGRARGGSAGAAAPCRAGAATRLTTLLPGTTRLLPVARVTSTPAGLGLG